MRSTAANLEELQKTKDARIADLERRTKEAEEAYVNRWQGRVNPDRDEGVQRARSGFIDTMKSKLPRSIDDGFNDGKKIFVENILKDRDRTNLLKQAAVAVSNGYDSGNQDLLNQGLKAATYALGLGDDISQLPREAQQQIEGALLAAMPSVSSEVSRLQELDSRKGEIAKAHWEERTQTYGDMLGSVLKVSDEDLEKGLAANPDDPAGLILRDIRTNHRDAYDAVVAELPRMAEALSLVAPEFVMEPLVDTSPEGVAAHRQKAQAAQEQLGELIGASVFGKMMLKAYPALSARLAGAEARADSASGSTTVKPRGGSSGDGGDSQLSKVQTFASLSR